MTRSVLHRSTAGTLVLGFLTMASSGMLQAASPSSMSGRVLAQNGADPRPGVVVALYEPATEKTFRSAPTDAKGAFTIDSAPAGDYAVLVEAPEGAFLAASHVQLAPGVNRPVSLALKPGKAGAAPPEAPAANSAPKSGTPTWTKWLIAGGIVVGAAIVIDAVTKNNNEASSF